MMLATPLNATVTSRIAGGVNCQGIDIQLMWPCRDGHASVTFLFGLGFARFTQRLMDWVCEEGFCDEATRDKDWIEYPLMLIDGREPLGRVRAGQAVPDRTSSPPRPRPSCSTRP